MRFVPRYSGVELESPEHVDANLYDPDLTAGHSLDVLNGHLDYRNMNYPSDGPLPLSGIRRGALFRGKMVGATLNADYHKRFVNYQSSSPHYDSNQLEPIPGTGIEFFAPCKGLLMLTWQVCYSSDLDATRDKLVLEGPDAAQRAFISLMGAKNDNFDLDEIGYRQYLPQCIEPDRATVDGARIMGMGRMWSGHHVVDAKIRTWYRYGLGVFSCANLTRIRVRNFKYLFFPNSPEIENIYPGSEIPNGL